MCEPDRAEPVERQLSLDDALQEVAVARLEAGQRPEPGELERLGDEFGVVLVELLERHGWRVHPIRTPFTADDVALVAVSDWREARGTGETLTKAAIALVADITRYHGFRQVNAA